MAGLFKLKTVPELQSPPVTPAWKMATCSVAEEKLVKVMVEMPSVPVSGPNTLKASELKNAVTLYGLLGSTTSTKVALMAAVTFGAATNPAKASVRRPVQRIVFFRFVMKEFFCTSTVRITGSGRPDSLK